MLEQRTAGQTRTVTAKVGDVGIEIKKSSAPAELDNSIVLSNCSQSHLTQ